nr:hypothetical protein [Nonomuraea polychroma]
MGTASAAASETAPRNPATPLTSRARLLTRSSRCCGRRSSNRIVYAAANRKAKRTATRSATATVVAVRAWARARLVRPRTAGCSLSPTRTNREPLSTKVATA